jgi:predicted DNA-binding transcriptional regulator YafY
MRRADRLFAIVQMLRGRRLTTAAQLANRLGTSTRTIYRDIRDLSTTGVPIIGEAGVGYALDKSFDVPPIMFSRDEIEALTIGARMVSSWGGTALATQAASALEKIAAVTPPALRLAIDTTQIYAPDFHIDQKIGERFEASRQAIRLQRKLEFAYADKETKATSRTVRPLALHFWGDRWTLAAWCELRIDFRVFRIDRIKNLRVSEETFRHEVGKTLQDFLRHVERETTSTTKYKINKI